MAEEETATQAEIDGEHYTITRTDVLNAFEQTEPPYDSYNRRIYVNDEAKGVKDVFRNISMIPDDTTKHTDYITRWFQDLGFETGNIEDAIDQAQIDQAWYIGFNHEDAWDERYWWTQFKKRGSISIGYPGVETDLSDIENSDQIRDEYDIGGTNANQLERFVQTAETGDVVFGKSGMRYTEDNQWAGNGEILAIGVITGDYVFEDPRQWYDDLPGECRGSKNYHHREVEWITDLEDTPRGSFTPDVKIQRGTIYEADYEVLKTQFLDAYDLVDAFEQLEERARLLSPTVTETTDRMVWIEKSKHSSGYKEKSGWGLGEVIWCPQTMSNDSTSVHYENIKNIKPNDVIVHLDQEEREFTSASIAANTYTETTCPEGSRWDEDGMAKMGLASGERPAYKLPLQEHTEFNKPLDVDAVLNRENKEKLDRLRSDETVVYNKNLNLNQGAYLTKAPDEFVALIDDALDQEVGHGLPHVSVSDGPEPVEEYESIEEAIADVRGRLAHKDAGNDWLLNLLGEYVVQEWSGALSGYKPSDEVSEETGATFDRLRAIYEGLEPELEAKASELGVGSLVSFPPKTTLFLSWVRILQEDLNVEGAVLSQPRLNSILKDTYSIPTEPEKEYPDTVHQLTTRIQTADPTVYKFTAPPDYWLTTYAFAALGLEDTDRETWQGIKADDIILFHSRQEPGWEELDTQDSCILGAGVVQATTTKPTNESWWYDEQPDRPKAESFPYVVAFERLYLTGDVDAIDFSTRIEDKSAETVNADLAALTAGALAFEEADAISAEAGDSGFPRHQTITPLGEEKASALAAELAPTLESVPPVAMHKSFSGALDADVILDGLYFPEGQGEEIVAQLEGALQAGKHAILTGPPGTGKTEIARRVGEYLADEYPYLYSGAQVTTATADWSTFDTVGGYMPNEDDTDSNDLEFTPGLVLNRFKTRQGNVQRNEALVIDELNRADIDKAFGQLFTVLSGQPVQLPYTKMGEEVDLAPIGKQSLPASHEYRIPEAWSLFGTLNTYDKTSLYEMSYAFMRRFAFIRVPAPDLGELDETELQDLLATYTGDDMWATEVGAIKAPASVDPLLDVGLVWQATNESIDDRAVGPAVVRDIIEALVATPSIPWERRLTQAVISYIFPQLEGVPKRKRVIKDLADVGRLEETYLDQAARDMLQVAAIQESDEAE